MRGSIVLGLSVALALALPTTALGHAQLDRSDPADRAVLASPPREARFVFDDPVRAGGGIRAVRNGDGSVLAGKARIVGGRTLVVPLRQELSDGDYTVLWRVVSDDGHRLEGVISFGVGAGRAPPTASLTAANGPSSQDVVARWLFIAGILVAGGGALFRIVVGAGRERVLLGGFLLVFLGGSALLSEQGSLSSRFGLAVGAGALVAAVGAALAAISLVESRAVGPAWACGLLVLPAPSFAGHALDAGRPRIEILVDLLHLTAAAAWVGGLVQLAFVLRPSAELPVIRRFSLLALASVISLSATGVARAFAELGAFEQLWSTGYGRLLIVKTGLLAALVALGWVNRYRLLHRGAFGTLKATVRVELLLVAGLVVAIALLTDVRPGRDRTAGAAAAVTPHPAVGPPALPPKDAFVVAAQDLDRAVALSVVRRRVRTTVLGADGRGVDGLRVVLAGRTASPCGAGCYQATLAVPPRGSVDVLVGSRRLTLSVPASGRGRDARSLVARATRAFSRLRSVSYLERLGSSPRNRIDSEFTLEAPNRFAYRIRGGSSAIVIGERRWDRVAGGPWDATPQTPLPQPTPIWEGPISNARVVSESPAEIVVTFLNRRGPAWFTVHLDRRTLLPRILSMTAAAHFMHHSYFGFDAPRRIKAPGASR